MQSYEESSILMTSSCHKSLDKTMWEIPTLMSLAPFSKVNGQILTNAAQMLLCQFLQIFLTVVIFEMPSPLPRDSTKTCVNETSLQSRTLFNCPRSELHKYNYVTEALYTNSIQVCGK
ncbi:hypothetical protein L798_12688 [Zootermopsis nevadensis]|uniref:Uncharacterized protein n=1 Tax=Zootermopsis nevadensis TaxID=136037 RepID=A0A067RPK1_ZOONE|nr:hypothetical protein L798_12688 [Zootermopsis nevadensis]